MKVTTTKHTGRVYVDRYVFGLKYVSKAHACVLHFLLKEDIDYENVASVEVTKD